MILKSLKGIKDPILPYHRGNRNILLTISRFGKLWRHYELRDSHGISGSKIFGKSGSFGSSYDSNERPRLTVAGRDIDERDEFAGVYVTESDFKWMQRFINLRAFLSLWDVERLAYAKRLKKDGRKWLDNLHRIYCMLTPTRDSKKRFGKGWEDKYNRSDLDDLQRYVRTED